MKISNHIYFVFSLLIYTTQTHAQNYDFTTFQQPYTPLVSGFPLTEGVWDNPTYVVPIGFDFPFFDVSIDQLLAEFGAGGALTTIQKGSTVSILYVIGNDLIDRGYHIGSSMSTILFDTMGSAPDRVFIQEWINAGFAGGDTANGIFVDFVNFQLRLFEGSGMIEYHFGPSSITNAAANFDGLPGPVVGLVDDFDLFSGLQAEEVYLLVGDPETPGVEHELGLHHLAAMVPPNTVYRFRNTTTAIQPVPGEKNTTWFYPNPTSGILQMREDLIQKITFPVSVFNSTGLRLKSINEASEINLTDLPAGIYSLVFSSGKQLVSSRIVLH